MEFDVDCWAAFLRRLMCFVLAQIDIDANGKEIRHIGDIYLQDFLWNVQIGNIRAMESANSFV